MWKIVLVEDEPFVRKQLCEAISWEQFGFRIVGVASHGNEALQLIDAHEPHLVITDIMMPYMDGIELLTKVRSQGRSTKFVMLTCMSEFEYARNALVHGASDYLLKLSLDDSDLERVLMKIGQELRAQELVQLQCFSYDYQKLLEYSFNCIHGREAVMYHEESLDDLISRSGLNSFFQYCTAVTVLADQAYTLQVLDHMLVGKGQDYYSQCYSRYEITTYFVWSNLVLIELDQVYFDFERPIVIDHQLADKPLIPLWEKSLMQLEALWYANNSRSLTLLPNLTGLTPATVAWEDEKALIMLMEQCRIEQCIAQLTMIWSSLQSSQCSIYSVKDTAQRINRQFARISHQPAEESSLFSATSHQALLSALLDCIQHYAHCVRRKNWIDTDHQDINRLLDFIHAHLDQDITVKKMADRVHLDEQYLSRLFKQKVGEPLIQYVQKLRIERAKLYLEQTELTISEIGNRVGFINDNYFFKIFKRWTGMTPNAFRTNGGEGSSKP